VPENRGFKAVKTTVYFNKIFIVNTKKGSERTFPFYLIIL
jgi:hypothetical protein